MSRQKLKHTTDRGQQYVSEGRGNKFSKQKAARAERKAVRDALKRTTPEAPE